MRNWLGGWMAGCIALAGCGDDGAGETTSPGTVSTTMMTTGVTVPPTTTTPTSTGDEPGTTTTGEPLTTGESTGESTGDPPTTEAPGVCGDSVVNGDEECDDGNSVLTDACLPTCVAAICGDGVLQTGVEDCDDTNSENTDACVDCKDAVCGDGFVHAGVEGCDDANNIAGDGCSVDCKSESCGNGTIEGSEQCDDANTDDTDDCTSLCNDAACGDGFVQAGVEPCDDGNTDDTDACIAGCIVATCGDGFVQAGVEGCDDANADESDECTSACKLPTCNDKAQNGPETDVDCGGGTCPKCPLGDACAATTDCMAGLCLSDLCAVPKSCQDIKQGAPDLPSGAYTIDLDGGGPFTPLQVYCDQETDGGGWTMVSKFSNGVGGDGNSLWNNGPFNDGDASLLNTMKSAKQYVSRFPTSFWNQNGISVTAVRMHAYTADTLAKFWKYDGVGTTSINWFAAAKLVASSYSDLPAGPFNFYSIAGDAGNGRRWYINNVYNGCPGDIGWLIVDSTADPCTWETNKGAPAMRLLYAPGTTKVTWDQAVNGNTVGIADALAVFIR